MNTPFSLENAVRNLLAVIHRDGGHHTARVGLERSLEDAEKAVIEDRETLDRAELTIQRIKARRKAK